jgi:insertion element IS1 protein InsB
MVKNGKIHNIKQNHKCRFCGRQFVLQPQKKLVSPETRALMDCLLLEPISLVGIDRAAQVSETWPQAYVNDKYDQIPQTVTVTSKKGSLVLECDELWFFVGNKNQKYWIWLALDWHTREIVGVYLGDRSQDAAQDLWSLLPAVYQQCAVCYINFWQAH